MRVNIKSAIIIGLFLFTTWAISASSFPASSLPGISLTNGAVNKKELSGIIWHNTQQIFYLVSDNDYLTKMTSAGQILSHIPVNGNMEAVTMIPGRNDFIYIGIEDPDSIYEYNINTNQITRVFDLTDWMDGPDNNGLEGLTFIPDSSSSEGGLFYAGMQDNGRVFIFRLPIFSSSTSTSVTHLQTVKTVDDGLSDMYYSSTQNILYIIYDKHDLLAAFRLNPTNLASMTLLGQWELPGSDQEGIVVKGKELYIAEDYGKDGGEVFRYRPFMLFDQPDITGDNFVDLADLAALSANWLKTGNALTGNINQDSTVNLTDLQIMSENWLSGH